MAGRFLIFLLGFSVGTFLWIFAIWLTVLLEDRMNEPKTKDEWKVM